MSDSSVVSLLSKVEIFSALPSDLLDKLAASLFRISFEAETQIISKGNSGDSMYVIESGKVRIHDGQHTIATMETGNFFGEFSLLDSAPRSMSVTAVVKTTLLIIEQKSFYELLHSQSNVARKIISTLTRRLRTQNESIISQLQSREKELTRLVEEKTRELRKSNDEITIKNKEITDNVNYAKRIQNAILPEQNKLTDLFRDSFILYIPKDIVSGDFYSFFETNESKILIAADCTGHGVTGAMLSVVGASIINKIILEKKLIDPARILDLLNEEIITTLNQRNGTLSDGMDVAVCVFDKTKSTLNYAGAHRPLWLIRQKEIKIFSPDKMPIGGNQVLRERGFQTQKIEIIPGDSIYIFTDGYADQFGGDSGRKLMTKKLKEILLSINYLSMEEQKLKLNSIFEKWKGSHEQVDDVLLIGVKIPS